MRVAFVSMYTHHRRDTEKTRGRYQLAKRLQKRGHEVTILCSRWWDGSHPTFEQDGIEYRAVDGEFSAQRFRAKLPFALRAADADVVHIPHRPTKHGRAAITACRLLRKPVVVSWWRDDPADSDADYRKLARKAERGIVPSETIKTAVREHGADEATLSVIPEGLDFSTVESAAIDDRFDVVYSRQLDRHANVETLLLALAELRGRDWRAAVIGDGPAGDDAKRTAQDLRIDDRVEFLGSLSETERVRIFKGAHVFAQTAEVEPFATELLWALACGCVGIAEYQLESAAHELIDGKSRLDGTRGQLVSTPQELADEIVAAGALEKRTVDEAYKHYDHSRITGRYLTCYQAAIDSYGLF